MSHTIGSIWPKNMCALRTANEPETILKLIHWYTEHDIFVVKFQKHVLPEHDTILEKENW